MSQTALHSSKNDSPILFQCGPSLSPSRT